MTLFEILRFNRNMLGIMQELGIREDDYRYYPLYCDYLQMMREGEKVTYIVAVLAERYHLCERKVYSLIRRYKTDCTDCTLLFEPIICC